MEVLSSTKSGCCLLHTVFMGKLIQLTCKKNMAECTDMPPLIYLIVLYQLCTFHHFSLSSYIWIICTVLQCQFRAEHLFSFQRMAVMSFSKCTPLCHYLINSTDSNDRREKCLCVSHTQAVLFDTSQHCPHCAHLSKKVLIPYSGNMVYS